MHNPGNAGAEEEEDFESDENPFVDANENQYSNRSAAQVPAALASPQVEGDTNMRPGSTSPVRKSFN